MWSLFQAHLIVSLVQNLRISIDIYFIEPRLIYPRGREYRSFARWSKRKLLNSKRATISILARGERNRSKTELLKSRSSLTNHERKRMRVSLSFRSTSNSTTVSQKQKISKRRNTLSSGIYRSINLPTVLRRFYWLESDETKWRWNRFPFRQICFVLTSIPIRRKYGLSRLLSPLRPRCHSSLDKRTLLSSSTRGGHQWWNYSYGEIRTGAFVGQRHSFLRSLRKSREEILKFMIGFNSTNLTNGGIVLPRIFPVDIYISYINLEFANLKIRLSRFSSLRMQPIFLELTNKKRCFLFLSSWDGIEKKSF